MSSQPQMNVSDLERALKCATWGSRTYGFFGVLSFSGVVAIAVILAPSSEIAGILRFLTLTILLTTIGCAYTRHSMRLIERVLHLNLLLFTIRNLRNDDEMQKFMDKVTSAGGPTFVGNADQSLTGKFLGLLTTLLKQKAQKGGKRESRKTRKQDSDEKPQSSPNDTPPQTDAQEGGSREPAS